MAELVQVTGNISYLPATRQPISCDVVFIKAKDADGDVTWIFDVGLSKEAAEAINKVEGRKNIVISHFHPDHVFNLVRVSYDNLYVSANTKKYVLKGTVLREDTVFETEPAISVVQLPSSHAKGCLCLVCGDYAFMGDGTYAKEKRGDHTYNAQLLRAEIEVMERLPARYVCLDHDKNFIQERTDLLTLHKEIYARRKDNGPTISVEDFFNPDGSVKEVV